MNSPPLSSDTIDTVLWHREVGWAKDLSALPRAELENIEESILLAILLG